MNVPDIRRPAGDLADGWDPWREMDALFGRMNRLMGGVLGQPAATRFGGWAPRVEVTETEQGYQVEAEVPGLKPEELRVEVDAGLLRIHGESRRDEEETAGTRGSRRGRLDYQLRLPSDVDPEKVEADLDHGLLTVRLVRSEPSGRRQVEIRTGTSRPD